MTGSTPKHHRPIRSFVRREGRLTAGQQRALDTLWPRFGIEFSEKMLDLASIFGRSAPITLEIGFGNGESLATMAQAEPERDFLGIEVHRPGVGHLLQRIEALRLTNLRVMCHDAVEVLKHQIPPGSLDTVQIFFPDPWHKKRHHKRRIIQPAFVALLAARMRPGGVLHLATDWEDYAQHMLEVLEASPQLRNTASGFAPRPAHRPPTKFEERGQRLGHGVWDVVFDEG
jgi:tRNA (guanine-N7-)-methyltransferase